LTSAAINDEPKLTCSALSVRGAVAMLQISGDGRAGLEEQPDDRDEDDEAEIGERVSRSVSPKPGMTLGFAKLHPARGAEPVSAMCRHRGRTSSLRGA
jgi:hypothetical protein